MDVFSAVVIVLATLAENWHPTSGCVLNTDVNFQRWPNKVVPFIFYPGDYTSTESSLILQAMAQVSSDMGGCVTFSQLSTPPTSGLNYVIISKAGGPGTASPTCYTYPGMIWNQKGLGQYMSIQGGVNGCLSNVRQVMRMLVSLLGQRFEHNKPNRDTYININTGNANSVSLSVGAYNIYSTSVLNNAADFDYNSITLLDPVTYSSNGGPVISSKNGTALFNSGRLSFKDCQCLSFQYSCSVSCQNVYGANPLPTQFVTNRPPPTSLPPPQPTTFNPFNPFPQPQPTTFNPFNPFPQPQPTTLNPFAPLPTTPFNPFPFPDLG